MFNGVSMQDVGAIRRIALLEVAGLMVRPPGRTRRA